MAAAVAAGRSSEFQPPASRAGSRFGDLSRSSFFARHNPHPSRCVHIRGLLGLMIPVVVDDCQHDCHGRDTHRPVVPVGAININSQKHPLDTINGLQYFTNLRNYSFKEKAVPRLGLVPVTENWREHLRSLTEQTFQPMQPAAAAAQPREEIGAWRREATCPDVAATGVGGVGGRQHSSGGSRPLYSQQTGRIMPPPSRSVSRRGLRSRAQSTGAGGFEHISASPDLESAVFSMLCQILQTEDTAAVQAWLVSASDRERGLVMDMIRSAVDNRDAYYELTPTGQVADPHRQRSPANIREDLHLPPIEERHDEAAASSRRVDRLVVEQEEAAPAQAPKQTAAPAAAVGKPTKKEKREEEAKVRLGAANGGRPQRQQQAAKKQQPKRQPTMKYSKTEPGLRGGVGNSVWKPNESYAA